MANTNLPSRRLPLLLLLSRDLRLAARDLRLDHSQPADEPVVEQLAFLGFEPPAARTPRRRSRPSSEPRSAPPADDPLLTAFLRRLVAQGRARKGRNAYRYQMRSILLIAERLTGRALTCAELFQDPGILGRALVDDTAPTRGPRLSKWTLAQRRSAIRSFATLMRSELLPLLGEEPNVRLDRALQAVADRVGAGYRLTGGAPRRRGGRAPSAGQIRDVLDAVARGPGYLGARNRAFFTILSETGARVNALRTLDGADCVEMPSGRLRVFLHEKGKAEPREVELSRAATETLRAYAEAFNYLAATKRWGVRILIGKPGPVWRNSPRGRWSYGDILATLRDGCSAAEVPGFTPHALRRAFATDAATMLPRHTVAQAGGWQGLERLDDHYVQPRAGTIREKLSRAERGATPPGTIGDVLREPAPAL